MQMSAVGAVGMPVANDTNVIGERLLDKTELSPTFVGVATFGVIALCFAVYRMLRPRKATRSVTVAGRQSADDIKVSGTRADAWELNPAAEAAAKADSTPSPKMANSLPPLVIGEPMVAP